MQTKISKSLFSNLIAKISHFPKSLIIENSPSLGAFAYFSTVPNRPMRGNRRSDDDLNFEYHRYEDNVETPHQIRPSRLSKRPLRGDQGHMRRVRGEDSEENIDGSLKIGDREKERDQFGDTLLEDLNFGDMGSSKNAKGTHDMVHGSLKIGDGEREKDPSNDTLLNKWNFGEMGSTEKGIESHKNAQPLVPEDADEIFKKMKEAGLIPNAVSMLDGLCKDGLVQEAMKLFGLMRQKGTIPEVVVYTAVVEGFCKAAKFNDAKRIFRKMQKNGIVPNAFSYGVVIQGLCRGKRLDDAVEFCMEMLDAGHSPNAATLTGLVNEFCNEKGAEEGEGFVRSLREKGFAIDEKAVREFLDKKGPYSPMVWEAIFGKRNKHKPF